MSFTVYYTVYLYYPLAWHAKVIYICGVCLGVARQSYIYMWSLSWRGTSELYIYAEFVLAWHVKVIYICGVCLGVARQSYIYMRSLSWRGTPKLYIYTIWKFGKSQVCVVSVLVGRRAELYIYRDFLLTCQSYIYIGCGVLLLYECECVLCTV